MATREAGKNPSNDDAVIAGSLITTLNESHTWYAAAVERINAGRRKRQRLEIVSSKELIERAADWPTYARMLAVKALHATVERPVLMMPIPVPRPEHPLTREETVMAWANARNGHLAPRAGRLAFLNQWPVHRLTGNDPRGDKKPVRFVAIETAYTAAHEGTRDQQLRALRPLQHDLPALRTATLLEGAILTHRYASDEVSPRWEDTLVRAIELKPHEGLIPLAYVRDDGDADILGIPAGDNFMSAARRAVE